MQHLDEGLIHAWLDGALSDEEARQAEAHVESCEACRAAVAEARGLIAASSMILSKLDVDGPTAAPASAPIGATETAPPAGVVRFPVKRPLAGYRLRAAAAVLILAGGVAAVGRFTSGSDIGRVVDDAASESAILAVPEQAAVGDATAAVTDTPAPLPPPPTVEPAPHLPRPQGAAANRVIGRPSVAAPREAEQDARPLAGQRAADGGTAGDVSGQVSSVVRTALPTAEAAAEEELATIAAKESAEQMRRQETGLAQRARAAMAPPAASDAPAPSALRRTESAPASAAFAVQAITAPRCYALSLSPWQPAGPAVPAPPPERIVLSADTGTVGAARGQRLVRPAGDVEDRYQAAWWTEVHPTTLILTWATGSEGIVMRLVRSDDRVQGTARTFGAGDGIERAAEVSGRLVDCGSAR